ncbi:hypothetical protein MKX03_030648 [Papaver bracteatum]|nr:hypothetical protein MKX03_030648 [Papaver bracteatum]
MFDLVIAKRESRERIYKQLLTVKGNLCFKNLVVCSHKFKILSTQTATSYFQAAWESNGFVLAPILISNLEKSFPVALEESKHLTDKL